MTSILVSSNAANSTKRMVDGRYDIRIRYT